MSRISLFSTNVSTAISLCVDSSKLRFRQSYKGDTFLRRPVTFIEPGVIDYLRDATNYIYILPGPDTSSRTIGPCEHSDANHPRLLLDVFVIRRCDKLTAVLEQTKKRILLLHTRVVSFFLIFLFYFFYNFIF